MHNELFAGIKLEDRRFVSKKLKNNLEDFCNFEKVSGSLWHLQVRVTVRAFFCNI